MSIEKFELTVKDLGPAYLVTIEERDGTVVDISGATIVCTMRPKDGSTPIIDRSAVGISITDGPNGQFKREWQSGDSDLAGLYNIEFEVSPLSGGKMTFPRRGQGTAVIEIFPALDAA